MKTIKTLGGENKRTTFSYEGSIITGVTLLHKYPARIDADFFQAALAEFAGKKVVGGFSMTSPTPGGFGEWVEQASGELNSKKLTPRHGSFMAAILVKEAGVESWLKGNAVWLRFPDRKSA